MSPMNSRSQTTASYANFRLLARNSALSSLTSQINVSINITDIDSDSMQAWKNTWLPNSMRQPPNGGWNWEAIKSKYSRKPKHLSAAIWSNTELCGLVVGDLNKTAVKIDAIEGSPVAHHPLRGLILAIGLEYAAKYAQASRLQEIWAIEPGEAIVGLYLRLGFAVGNAPDGRRICKRRLNHDELTKK